MIPLIIIAAIAIYIFLTYNSLISAKMKVSEALSQIDVQLKRRTDLIPNLVSTVKGYAKHEKDLFEKVTEARSSLMSAKSVSDKADANNQLSKTLKSLFAVAEAYPNLRASENFKALQEELEDTENKIAYSRQFYNSVTMDYNTKLKVFPTVIFANLLSFKPSDFFAIDEKDKKLPEVKF